ncbi:IclR family transcriptional regulator [Ramlibacter tataouinensis]|uniref:IclR family transcriptional regulator n=1 Tax=Ramlibacter tataouinensis TaxID=94132 RepID=A0A127JZF4_9BURK|nr:IclR family transcriptional regulator [Ramlibacter tataouinensis]AMO25304.1 IclR family transcriptional regulator [Ramlibacter tataouinensis]
MAYTVESVDEALGLLSLVAQAPGLGVTELSKRSGITKARAFRLLTTLEERGFVQRQAEAATYQLGSASLLIGMAAVEQVSLVRQAVKHLEQLGAKFNEDVQVRIRNGLETLCVARWESTHDLRFHTPIGSRRPLHAGASGKLLLAFAPEAVAAEILAADVPRYTPQTLSRTKLSQELGRIRKQGYSVSHGEISADVVAIAAPVRDGSGQVIAAISIAAPASRAPDKGEKFIQPLLGAAQALSAELGFRAPA